MSMTADPRNARPEDVVRALFDDAGPSDAYDVGDVDVVRDGDRMEIRFSVGSVKYDSIECFALGRIVGGFELNGDGEDTYRTHMVVRYDHVFPGSAVILDCLHTCGEFNDDEHSAHVSGTLAIVPPERGEIETANALDKAGLRASAAIADSIRSCIRRMRELDDDAFRGHHLQGSLRELTRHMAERL